MNKEEFLKARSQITNDSLRTALDIAFYREHGTKVLAVALDIPYRTALDFIKSFGIDPKRGSRRTKESLSLNEQYYNEYKSGKTLKEIAARYDVSSERIRQRILAYEKRWEVKHKANVYKGLRLIEKTCLFCGKCFTPKRSNKEMYCSASCGHSAGGIKLRAKLPAQDIIKEYQNGVTYLSLAQKYGCAHMTIWGILKRAGVISHPKGWRSAKPIDHEGNDSVNAGPK